MSYKLIIGTIDTITPIVGADRIVAATIFGKTVVVGKDVNVGDIMCYADTDGIFEDEFCRVNNLFPIKDENGKKIGGGFFTEGRARIRAQKFVGVKSEGFAFPLSFLSYTKYDLSKLKIGDQFDELNGIKICSKFINEATLRAISQAKRQGKKIPKAPLFFEHQDTEQFDYNARSIPTGALITLLSKKHGTSGRYSYSTTYRELPYWRQLFNKVYPLFSNSKDEHLVGTRRVVLMPEEEIKEGFHGSEAFRYKFLSDFKDKIPFGITIYLEICGWANNKPIMSPHSLDKDKNLYKELKDKYPNPMFFSYGNLEGECDYSVYRVTFTTREGKSFDLSWEQIKHFCQERGMKTVREFEPSFVYNGRGDELKDKVYSYLDMPDIEDSRHYSEGVIVRIDHGGFTKFLKKKGFYFCVGEGIGKARPEEIDLEESS